MATINNNYRLAILTAAVTGVFSLIVCALLLYDYSRRGAINPSEDDVFLTLKAALCKQPDNDFLKKQVRNFDQHLRREYFRQRTFSVVGAGLLLAGVTIFLLSVKTAAAVRREIHYPPSMATPQDIESLWTGTGRWAVAALAMIFAATAITLSITMRLDIPKIKTEPETSASLPSKTDVAETDPGAKSKPEPAATATDETLPSDEEIAKAWPSFRGPSGSGISAYTNIPTEWDAESGKNIRWKTPIPLPGNNSPIVWKDKIFLTGANEKLREIYCFDTASGKMLWQKEVFSKPQQAGGKLKVYEDTGYAASTAATDGRRVFAIFPNGDLVAFDFNGKLVWSKSLGIPESAYGHASSLVTYKNNLVVQFDQGDTAEAAKSKILAFDSATGNPVWQTDRPVRNSWPSPIVIRAADCDQLITAAAPWVIAYDPNNGQEIWRAKCFPAVQDIGPSPVFAAGKIFVANESTALSAVQANGKGDVTASNIVWKAEDGLPDICSPLANDEYVFLLAYSVLTCYDTEKGDQLWTEDFTENCKSSPSMAKKMLYLFAENGKSWVAEPQREKCRRLAENNVGEECVTSPAFQDGCFYIRGKTNLICIGNK